MVGVPGKYKGCETCRRRRVKCTNERPSCKKCVSSGRQCEGYERERVFITGTMETKGRVASHPKKGVPIPKHAEQRRPSPNPETSEARIGPLLSLEFLGSGKASRPWPVKPVSSAWNDYILLSNHGRQCNVLISALQMRISDIDGQETFPHKISAAQGSSALSVGTPPGSSHPVRAYVPTLHIGPISGETDFRMNAQLLASFHEPQFPTSSTADDTGFCIFVFETQLCRLGCQSPKIPAATAFDDMKQQGPATFAEFPNHHYFVRVYRPMATIFALLRRQQTFLSEPEWTTLPWRKHPKSGLDRLFDIILFLPSTLGLSDQVLSEPPTQERRYRIQDLLQNCLILEKQFQHWYGAMLMNPPGQQPPFWTDSQHRDSVFGDRFQFREAQTGLACIYYWLSQIFFSECVNNLQSALYEPLVNTYPGVWEEPIPGFPIDPLRYHQEHILAANICRGLDSTLQLCAQPDLLLPPMNVALKYYRDRGATLPGSLMEVTWIEGFRHRLVAKGQQIASLVQNRLWSTIATF